MPVIFRLMILVRNFKVVNRIDVKDVKDKNGGL